MVQNKLGDAQSLSFLTGSEEQAAAVSRPTWTKDEGITVCIPQDLLTRL